MEEQKDLGSYSEDGTADAVSQNSTGWHTEGPWIAGKFSSIVGVPIMAQPDKTKNALVVAGTQSAVATDPQEFRAECEANARLIAAAPELLEALCVIKNAYENDGPIDWSIRRSFSVIAKALGQ